MFLKEQTTVYNTNKNINCSFMPYMFHDHIKGFHNRKSSLTQLVLRGMIPCNYFLFVF